MSLECYHTIKDHPWKLCIMGPRHLREGSGAGFRLAGLVSRVCVAGLVSRICPGGPYIITYTVMYSERYKHVTGVKLDSTVVYLDRIQLLWELFISEESNCTSMIK